MLISPQTTVVVVVVAVVYTCLYYIYTYLFGGTK